MSNEIFLILREDNHDYHGDIDILGWMPTAEEAQAEVNRLRATPRTCSQCDFRYSYMQQAVRQVAAGEIKE